MQGSPGPEYLQAHSFRCTGCLQEYVRKGIKRAHHIPPSPGSFCGWPVPALCYVLQQGASWACPGFWKGSNHSHSLLLHLGQGKLTTITIKHSEGGQEGQGRASSSSSPWPSLWRKCSSREEHGPYASLSKKADPSHQAAQPRGATSPLCATLPLSTKE